MISSSNRLHRSIVRLSQNSKCCSCRNAGHCRFNKSSHYCRYQTAAFVQTLQHQLNLYRYQRQRPALSKIRPLSSNTNNSITTTNTTTDNNSNATTNINTQLKPVLNDNESYLPIDFQAASKIEGEESHIATITLHPGEVLRTESGSMIYMTQGVTFEAKLNGVSSAFNRMLTGQNMFVTDFRYDGEVGTTGTVCLGTAFPSKILRMNLRDHPNQNLICQKGAYMASNPNIQIDMEFTKSLTAGFFGGEGFILQKLSGNTDVLIKGGGTIVCKELNDGESLRVTSGSLVCFQSTVSYDVQMIPGITNAMFGGEGLFITTLQGPGLVWLQGMPPDRMIAEIASRVPSGGLGIPIPIPIGGGGGGPAAGGISDAEGDVASAAGAAAGGAGAAIASDVAIEADRSATIATSGVGSGNTNVDSESQSALFGDTVPASHQGESTTSTSNNTTDFSEQQESMYATDNRAPEPTFVDDESTSTFSTDSAEPIFDDNSEEFQMDDPSSVSDGELFNDGVSANASENIASEGGSTSIFRQIWDFFSDFSDDD